MKIAAYEVRPDEKPVIEALCAEYGIDLVSTPANLDPTTASMAILGQVVKSKRRSI